MRCVHRSSDDSKDADYVQPSCITAPLKRNTSSHVKGIRRAQSGIIRDIKTCMKRGGGWASATKRGWTRRSTVVAPPRVQRDDEVGGQPDPAGTACGGPAVTVTGPAVILE
ncbi:hypothetical protein T492DRAFT_834157 [Pavlovales sp. CCMP2436]|nr:hypothetical protein T492DRAFT_834157 [Pavlovales sp. CCMP2436]